MKALILAAEYATRLFPLTKDRPKALLPIADIPIINYIVDDIVTIPDINEIIIVSNHKFAKHFEKWKIEAEKSYDLNFTVVDDNTVSDDDKLGAIGDIQFVIDQLNIDEEMLIVAGDNIFTYDLIDAYNYYKEHDTDIVLAQRNDDIEELRRFAVIEVDENKIVTNLEEKPEYPRSDIAVFAIDFYKKRNYPND